MEKRAIMGLPGFSCQEALSSIVAFWVSLLLILGEHFCALKDHFQSRSFSEHGWLGSPGLYGDTGALHSYGEPVLWPCRQRRGPASAGSWRWWRWCGLGTGLLLTTSTAILQPPQMFECLIQLGKRLPAPQKSPGQHPYHSKYWDRVQVFFVPLANISETWKNARGLHCYFIWYC